MMNNRQELIKLINFIVEISNIPYNSWFKNELVSKLDSKKIGTRLLFGGNLLKQPAFKNTPKRVCGELKTTNQVMSDTLWIGVWPGLTLEMLDYVIETFHELFKV